MQRPGEVVAGSPTQTAVWRLPCPSPPGTGAAGPGERRGPGQQKLDRDPWLKRIFAGYAFALEIEAYYDAEDVSDWVHAETGNKVLKAQHPELEVWSQGVPARAGVACADRHMPYQRAGALKVSDHWVQPAPQYQPRLPDLPRRVRAGAAGSRADDPGSPPRPAPAGGQGDDWRGSSARPSTTRAGGSSRRPAPRASAGSRNPHRAPPSREESEPFRNPLPAEGRGQGERGVAASLAEYFDVNNAQANLAPIPAGSTDEQACCCADMLSTGIMGASMPTSRAAGPWRSLPRDRSGRWPRWGRGSWGLGW